MSALPLLRFRCGGCGYGASSRRAPERCPMCGLSAWEDEGWKPFAEFGAELRVARAQRARLASTPTPAVREAKELGVPRRSVLQRRTQVSALGRSALIAPYRPFRAARSRPGNFVRYSKGARASFGEVAPRLVVAACSRYPNRQQSSRPRSVGSPSAVSTIASLSATAVTSMPRRPRRRTACTSCTAAFLSLPPGTLIGTDLVASVAARRDRSPGTRDVERTDFPDLLCGTASLALGRVLRSRCCSGRLDRPIHAVRRPRRGRY